MFNSIETVASILEEYNQKSGVKHRLKDFHLYYAHTPSKKEGNKETLSEHLNLVKGYFSRLVHVHQLDVVIDRLILCYLFELKINSNVLANFIKRIFVHSICYHDHGKVNENFQASRSKMNNPNFKGKENPDNGIGTQHSTLSAFIFLCHKIDDAYNLKFPIKELNIAISNCILFSYGIYKHHGKYFDDEFLTKIIVENGRAEMLLPYLSLFSKTEKSEKIAHTLSKLENVLPKILFEDFAQSIPLYQLLRLNFSLLTASDYLATNEYMNNDKTIDFGVLDRQRINELFKRVSEDEWLDEKIGKYNFNKKTYSELETLSLEKPTSKSNTNLNLLRQQMATEAIRNIRKHIFDRIFYLEAPTGGGKTNISMLIVLELLKANSKLNKVFYVFPFTTLIDQTFKSIQQSLGLAHNEIVALHSKASFAQEDDEGGQYGNAKKNYINHLFINYPFCLLSHVRFFEVLKTNEKEQNYILHRLANSIVVIDELQTYSPQHWDKVMYFIQQYSDFYNIRFIIMSATLPKINRLKIEKDYTHNVVYLLPNARKDYFQNVNFRDRVKFDFSLPEQKIELKLLVKKVLYESKQFAEINGGEAKPRESVYTIVEFIFKKTATRFYQETVKINRDFFDEIFVLSGTILEHRRRHIINFLKRKENRVKRILLITTQVVEAGVDIDMDLGFKDTSLLDSDEQLAGRINRNLKKPDCKLFLFNLNQEAVIYGKDLRYEMMKKELTRQEHEQILETKNFDLLYDKVIAFKDKRNQDPNFVGLKQYICHIQYLRFKSIAEEFKLIDQKVLNCFIPLSIPIDVGGESEGIRENVFSENDMLFMRKLNILPNENNTINGEEVFDSFMEIVYSKKLFIDRKIQLKQIQSILSKFTFSLFANPEMEKKIVHFSDMEKSDFGYYYIDKWDKFYHEESGINEVEFSDIENVQFL